MREGYDGRRGGIASGGARGVHRFDQLVAADNREDAKRLGLLNEDEMDSDDENENGEPKAKKDSADEDDEAALLDKMLKERFLNRDEEDAFEENFSDSEEEDMVEEQGESLQDGLCFVRLLLWRSWHSVNLQQMATTLRMTRRKSRIGWPSNLPNVLV